MGLCRWSGHDQIPSLTLIFRFIFLLLSNFSYPCQMKRLLTLLCLSIPFVSFSQIFWTENFGTGCSQNTSANGFVSSNGTWAITNTGANGAGANHWFVSATEAGMGANVCGDGCLNNGS